jgi:hypothetical protein
MDKKLFADLVESMQQHNEIISRRKTPVIGMTTAPEFTEGW